MQLFEKQLSTVYCNKNGGETEKWNKMNKDTLPYHVIICCLISVNYLVVKWEYIHMCTLDAAMMLHNDPKVLNMNAINCYFYFGIYNDVYDN